MKKIKEYSSKQAAKNGMWTYYNNNYANYGNPLIGDNGTTLQWVSNESITRWLSVKVDNNGAYIVELY